MASSDQIRDRGWRQSSVAGERLRKQLEEDDVLESSSARDLLIIASHDCDLLSPSFEQEPHVELLLARQIQTIDGNCLHGKNPRRLHFLLEDVPYEILAIDRYVAPRELLAEFDPHEQLALDETTESIIPEWIAKRHSRAALPDAFNDRIREVQAKIRRRLKKDGELVEMIFITLFPRDELPAEEEYQVLVSIVAREELFVIDSTSERLHALEEWMTTLIRTCEGVTLIDDCRVVSDEQLTLADMSRSIEWDVYDDLSFREG